MIDLNKPLEEVDYNVIPIKIIEDENAWQVELLRGDHKNKKLVFTNIKYDGKKRSLKFLLNVVINGETLEKPTKDLEDFAFKILEDIINNGIADGSVVFNDQDSSN